jgi:hypothetical protein
MAVTSCPKFATRRTAQSSGQARVLGCSFGRSFFTERFVAASVVDLFGGRRVPDYAAHPAAEQSRATARRSQHRTLLPIVVMYTNWKGKRVPAPYAGCGFPRIRRDAAISTDSCSGAAEVLQTAAP